MTLYSTGCPKCKVLAKKLNEAGISFDLVEGDAAVDEIMSHGFEAAPILQVDDRYLTFSDAIAMLREKPSGDDGCACCGVRA